jgi:hypothetical protein
MVQLKQGAFFQDVDQSIVEEIIGLDVPRSNDGREPVE